MVLSQGMRDNIRKRREALRKEGEQAAFDALRKATPDETLEDVNQIIEEARKIVDRGKKKN